MWRIIRAECWLLISIMMLVSCETQTNGQDRSATITKLEAFRKKKKFVDDTHPRLSHATLRPALNRKLNRVANDFERLVQQPTVTPQEYQAAIATGLRQFDDLYLDLDTEDREWICLYFEELMDIVGLESSGGHLNKFMYGLNLPDRP
ncbi:DUF4844 domain-containing protein [Hymenobacter taeanensis]|uniref:DUF4844 domain-containing protein n=1 Tax=Hymenobacter taeanensis TaxID=2735321 RepID=A0A6M6BI08_9BACT|nr:MULTISPECIES: DUF4844 domain-containing protein [Hymenobacter]QJX47612.1 DUF4844 domain-containing protein [Hymenobacter taeanensis]UOQ82904.1 DUF4844 domain-containing protein [Hymenobacter sp. 5414T-23]